MKKYKLKVHLKCFILLFGISLFLVNCQKDDFSNQENKDALTESNFKITTLRTDKILKKRSLLTKLDKIKTKLKVSTKTTSINGREVYSEENGFTINTDYCKEVFDGTTYTYTFPIYRDEDNDLLENLWLIEEADSTYTAYLVQYEFTTEDITALNFRQQINVENKITYIELNADELMGDIFGKYYYNGSCYEDNWVYQPGSICTANGNHTYSDGAYSSSNPNGCRGWGTSDMATNGGYVLSTTLVPCDGGGGNPSDPSNGGNPPDYNPTNPNGNPNHGGGNPFGSTTPVTCKKCPELEPPIDNDGGDNNNPDEKNCEELNKFSTNSYAQDEFNNLEMEIDAEIEKGYAITAVPFFPYFGPQPVNSNGNCKEINMPFSSVVYAFMHTHPTGCDNGTHPMFGPGDLNSLFNYSQNFNPDFDYPHDESLFAIYMTVANNHYAIKINDPVKLQTIGAIFGNDIDKVKFEKELQSAFNGASNNTTPNQDELTTTFLNFLKDKDLGVSLYKTSHNNLNFDPNTPPNERDAQWQKLVLDNSGTDYITEDCN
ncbi:hypothetical protein [Bizionia myxarmorum]|uniref:DUF4329 domain-containing protein n=1 Tax=Bizionia myxarmorum TaxID=291186 RepID=A0A5D0RC13_9FLAO|nr:hypothetical protein [Bizionia myxarmorum]TYB78446.1 hypothetical protein ES674_01300 [Bizionia myxarmorum]